MQQMALQGRQFVALPNGGQGGRFAATPIGRHPLYMPGGAAMSADVGLVRIAGQWPSVVRVAGPAELAALTPGRTIFVYGFPGQLNEPRSPVATLTTGIVGRITGFDGTAATPESAFLVQHSAFTSPGTSGSPVFSDDGLVVAVNTGAYRGSSREQVVDAFGQRSEVTITQDLHGYAFGVRVDLVQQLLLGIGGS
jgi:S1-C subfamily serine protease